MAETAGFNGVGVSAAYVRRVVEAVLAETGESDIAAVTLTTTEVAERFVLPATKVGPATVFVSHAWRYPFAYAAEIILAHAETDPEAYFWFDLFINNQHLAPNLPLEWWSTTFKQAIHSIGTVLLIASPWSSPVCVGRAWCLWEIMCALSGPDVKLHVRVPSSEAAAFNAALIEDCLGVTETVGEIDARRAEAFKASDREAIFKTIETTVGTGAINETVKRQLRRWCLDTAVALDENLRTAPGREEEHASLCDGITTVALQLDQLALAETYADEAYRARLAQLGPKSAKVARSRLNKAQVALAKSGDYQAVIAEMLDATALQEALLGPDDPELVNSYLFLASSYLAVDPARSQEYGDKCVKLAERVLKKGDRNLAKAYHMVALPLMSFNFEAAESYLQRALTIARESFGPNHPEVGQILGNIGLVAKRSGNIPRAIEFYEQALAISSENFAAGSISIASDRINYGNALAISGKLMEAIDQYETAMESLLGALGPSHNLVDTVVICLSRVYAAVGDGARAASLSANAKSGQFRRTTGPGATEKLEMTQGGGGGGGMMGGQQGGAGGAAGLGALAAMMGGQQGGAGGGAGLGALAAMMGGQQGGAGGGGGAGLGALGALLGGQQGGGGGGAGALAGLGALLGGGGSSTGAPAAGGQGQMGQLTSALGALSQMGIGGPGTGSPATIHSGWMAKVGGRIKTWKRRYFYLSSASLSYYKQSEMGLDLKGDIPLAGAELAELGHEARPYSFALVTSKRRWVLDPGSEQDRFVWMDKIRSVLTA